MDIARKMIYSVFMGFVLKLYLQSSYKIYKNWDSLFNGWENEIIADVVSTTYCVIIIYFVLNALRYVFGIFEFLINIDDNYAPIKQDWIKKNIFKNIGKQFVLNSGLIIVLLFGVLSQMLFPSSLEMFNPETNEITRVINALSESEIHNILLNFGSFILAITLIDLLSTLIYAYSKFNSFSNERIDEVFNERFVNTEGIDADKTKNLKKDISIELKDKYIEISLWIVSGVLELVLILLFLLFLYNSFYAGVKWVSYFMLGFLVIEYSGLFNYAKSTLSKYNIIKIDENVRD